MSENISPDGEQSAPHQGPGDRLQAARISIGMTIEDVAGKMHLSTSILTSLEENNFDDITAPIFVKGYLRAYSRLVNVDEDEIIQQYARYYMDGDPPISSTSNTLPEINADDSRVKWMTWFIILVLVTLLGLWWWNRYQQPPETLSLDATGKVDIAQDNNVLTPSETVATDAGEALQQESDGITETLDAGLEPAPKTSYAPAMDAVSTPPPEETQLVATEPVAVSPQEQTQTNVEPVEPAVSVEAEHEPVTKPVQPEQQGLTIVVNADTWASIKDADGKKLLKDLLRAGQTINLQGKTPINVFLGNGYGVSMTYNGKKIDFADKIKSNNTARIVIGK